MKLFKDTKFQVKIVFFKNNIFKKELTYKQHSDFEPPATKSQSLSVELL